VKRILVLLLSATALAVAGVHVATAHTTRVAVTNGVVVVNTNLAYENGAAAGTGMVLTANGEVLTNNHVIRGATSIRVVVPQTHRSYAARVVGYSVSADVAILQLRNASGLATVSLGDSSKLENGEAVTAVGNAGGTGSLTVTTGSIVRLQRSITVSDDQGGTEQLANIIETDASLQPGDSGGPLLDSAGQVIGMDTAASAGFYFQGGGGGDGFAIPIDRAATLAKQIEAGRASAQVHVGGTALLGVSIQPSGYYDASGAYHPGLVVENVVPGSPAAKAGVAAGDVITALGGHPVASQNAVVALLLPHHPGERIAVTWIDQATGSHTATVALANGPPQ